MLSCSEVAPIEDKMAFSRPTKRPKAVEKALQESIDECNRLLESSKKPRKKTRFPISRDPVKEDEKHTVATSQGLGTSREQAAVFPLFA